MSVLLFYIRSTVTRESISVSSSYPDAAGQFPLASSLFVLAFGL